MLKEVQCLKLVSRAAAISRGPFKNSFVKVLSGGTQSIAAMFSGLKCALSVVFLLALLFTANVSHGFAVLWWAVGESATVTDGEENTVLASQYTSQDGQSIGAARVRVTGNGVNMVLPLYMGNDEDGWELADDGTYTDELTRKANGDWKDIDWAAAHVDLGGDTSQYSFVVELGSVENVDGSLSWKDTLAASSVYSYSDLANGNHFSYGSLSDQGQLPLTINAFTAVPEPSVVMLLLLGDELLAFRRGRRKAVQRRRV